MGNKPLSAFDHLAAIASGPPSRIALQAALRVADLCRLAGPGAGGPIGDGGADGGAAGGGDGPAGAKSAAGGGAPPFRALTAGARGNLSASHMISKVAP